MEAYNIDDFLDNSIDFKDFFIKICTLKIKLDKNGLEELKNTLSKFQYIKKYGSSAITYLKDTIDCEIVLNLYTKNNKISEKDMSDYIINNFNTIFPEYNFICKEYVVKNIGRIDIYAKDKISNRDVIIELKTKNKNPNIHLLAYSQKFNNPILIGITEEKVKELNGIKYIIFNDIYKK